MGWQDVQREATLFITTSPNTIPQRLQRTYAAVVYAISSSDSWAVPADIKSRVVKEPIVRKLPDQPKKKRI